MSHLERNHEEWKEIRARVDSIASAVFLIAGGALSLSITVLLSNESFLAKSSSVTELATSSWYWLLASVILFISLKVFLVFQLFFFHVNTEAANKNVPLLNGINWLIGLMGYISFIWGMVNMVRAAACAIST